MAFHLFQEECNRHPHPDRDFLKSQRVRMYVINPVQSSSGCGSANVYLVDSYLIIDNATFSDSGEYMFSVGRQPYTSTQNISAEITLEGDFF